MKIILLLVTLLAATISNVFADECRVLAPISNTILIAGENMKIAWARSNEQHFSSISLVQLDGTNNKPIVIAKNVPTDSGKITVELPHNLIPSNAYYMTLGDPSNDCVSGSLRIVGSSSVLPPGKTPGGLTGHSSDGSYYHDETNQANSITSIITLTSFIALVISIAFTFS